MAAIPTAGERRILQFLSRVRYRLRAERQPGGVPVYRIIQIDTGDVKAEPPTSMIVRFTQRGWIEPVGMTREAQTWTYRLTEAGLAAAHLPADEL